MCRFRGVEAVDRRDRLDGIVLEVDRRAGLPDISFCLQRRIQLTQALAVTPTDQMATKVEFRSASQRCTSFRTAASYASPRSSILRRV